MYLGSCVRALAEEKANFFSTTITAAGVEGFYSQRERLAKFLDKMSIENTKPGDKNDAAATVSEPQTTEQPQAEAETGKETDTPEGANEGPGRRVQWSEGDPIPDDAKVDDDADSETQRQQIDDLKR